MKTDYKKTIQTGLTNLKKKMPLDKSLIEIEEILGMIRIRNGWTTLAEFKYTIAAVDSLTERIELIKRDISKLRDSADAVKASNF